MGGNLMNVSEVSIIITLSATLCVTCVYAYLYIQYRQRYLGFWIASWFIHLARLFFLHVPLPDLSPSAALGYALLIMLSSFILLCGTVEFLNTTLHTAWWFITVVTILASTMTCLTDLPFAWRALPACLFIGAVYSWVGILFIRRENLQGWGKHITGMAFIFLGIHTFDLPFLMELPWANPGGFILDALLRFIIAVGTLIVYFEKTRNDLEIKERQYRLLAENAADVIYCYRLIPTRGFEYISPSVRQLIGYTPEEFYTSPDLLQSVVQPCDWPLLEMCLTNPEPISRPLTMRLIRRDQTLIWVEQTSTLLFDHENHCIGFEGIIRDISVRKALEQDVARLDRLNMVGEMAASVAHEIRNPLTTIRGYLQVFSNKKEFAHYREQLGLLLDELDRSNLIIKEYLSLSQNKMVDMKLAHLNTIIESLYPLIQADAVASCKEIRLELDDTPPLYLDDNEIRQMILNLVRNGLEAMEEDGHLLTLQTYRESNELVFTVIDQGKGIPPHVLENLGRPFLTTKDNGTGLGLATCYRIANRHQAKIEVYTTPQGTTFKIRFKIPNKP